MKVRVFSDVKVHIRTEDILKKDVVYCLTFPSKKRYIGLTTQTLKERLREHIKESFRKGSKELNTKKARAIRKYMQFSVEILGQSEDMDSLNSLEMEFIAKFDTVSNGYNISIGGGGSKGIVMSQETKDKISQAKMGKPAHNKMPVEKYTLDGEFIETFDSITAAAASVTENKGGASKISEYLRGKRRTAYGFVWKLKE